MISVRSPLFAEVVFPDETLSPLPLYEGQGTHFLNARQVPCVDMSALRPERSAIHCYPPLALLPHNSRASRRMLLRRSATSC